MRSSISLFLLALTSASTAAAQEKSVCGASVADTAWLRTGPVYWACQVDQPAERRGGEPKLDLDPFELRARTPCQRVKLVFVVDTMGVVELETIRTISSDHLRVEAAVRAAVAHLAFVPARQNDRPVRQVIEYSRSVATPQRIAITVRRMESPINAPVADAPSARVKSC